MNAFFSGVAVVLQLELRQRVRGVAWYVLIGVFVALIAIVTALVTIVYGGFRSYGDTGGGAGGGVYSTIIYFVLLLGTLVTPALSGNAINGDREAGTLATTQVTLITTWQLLLGKFFAAWITALAFLVASLPFLLFASFLGGLSIVTVFVSALVLAFELGFVAAVGVGLSGVLTRGLFSIVLTYLVVAALSIGTLITFALGGLAVTTTVTDTYSAGTNYSESGESLECSAPVRTEHSVPRFDLFWGVLVANPYVLLADAVPTSYDERGNVNDLFGGIKVGVRYAQIAPQGSVHSDCDASTYKNSPTAEETINSTVPGWFVGMLIHLVLGAGALVWAWRRTNTPAGRLPKGSRVA